MLYLRTASGDFINAATIVQLSPRRSGMSNEISSWVAICGDGRAIALAAYYAVPGRIETVRGFMPELDTRTVADHAS